MNMMITSLQPSQLYLSEKKLAAVKTWLKKPTSFKDPILIRRFSNSQRLVIIDGHTRAFVAFQMGMTEIPVIFDEEELSKDLIYLYETCINWCQLEKISTIQDLANKKLAPEDYERKWLKRCATTLQNFEKL